MTTFTRMRTCMECGTQWEAPVVLGPTFNLTGELTPPCVKCDSKAIASGPIPQFVEIDKAVNVVTRALQGLGMRDAAGMFECIDCEEGVFGVTFLLCKDEKLEFSLQATTRQREVKTIAKTATMPYKAWVVEVTVMCSGTYWDPPYEDSMEIACETSPEAALIEATLSYFRNRMYDCIPWSEPNLDPTMEDVQQ